MEYVTQPISPCCKEPINFEAGMPEYDFAHGGDYCSKCGEPVDEEEIIIHTQKIMDDKCNG